MGIVFYTTHCPKCEILYKKLEAKNINYTEETDVAKMIDLGIRSAPTLQVDGQIMNFTQAVKWVGEQ